MNKFFTNTLSKVEEWILSGAVILMAALLIMSVFARVVLNQSLTFSEEIATALLILVSFLGLEYCARKGRHITMSIVYDLLNNKYKKILSILIALISAIVSVYLAYLSYRYVSGVQGLGRVTPALQIPMYIIYSVVPLGFSLTAIEYIRQLTFNIKDRDRLYITSEISVPMDSDLGSDLSSFIDKVEEKVDKEGEEV